MDKTIKEILNSLIPDRICGCWMIRFTKRKILLNSFIMVGLLLIIPVLHNHVQGQDAGSPGTATLEELLEEAKEKIRQAQSPSSYSFATTNTQSNQSHSNLTDISAQEQSSKQEWKTLICSLCGLSLEYPPTVPGEIPQPDEDRFKKEHSVYFYDNTIGFFYLTYIVGTPNENVTYEDVKKLRDWWLAGDRFYDSYFIVEDINMTKWEIDGEKTGSFILGREKGSPYNLEGMEILLTYHNNHQYKIEFITNATIFDTPYIQNTEKRIIESIKWLK